MRKRKAVGKIGWLQQNDKTNIVLMDKKLRASMDLKVGSMVKVIKGRHKQIAVVNKQFWELVGTDKVTLNSPLATKVGVNEDEKVTIETDVSKEEAEQFRRQFIENLASVGDPLARLFLLAQAQNFQR